MSQTFEIRCVCCGLLLGEAEQAVEMVCPLCISLRQTIKQLIFPDANDWFEPLSSTNGGAEWMNEIHRLEEEGDEIFHEFS